MDSPPSPTPPGDQAGRRGAPGPGWCALAAAGTVLAVLPHLVRAVEDGRPDVHRRRRRPALSRLVARHRPPRRPGDDRRDPPAERADDAPVAPVRPAGAGSPTRSGLGMTGLGVVWRLLAGPAVALGLYAAVRPFTKIAAGRGRAGGVPPLRRRAALRPARPAPGGDPRLAGPGLGPSSSPDVPRLMPHLRVPTPAPGAAVLPRPLRPGPPGAAAGDGRLGRWRRGPRSGCCSTSTSTSPRPRPWARSWPGCSTGRAGGPTAIMLVVGAVDRGPGDRSQGRRSRRARRPTGSSGPTSSPRSTGSTPPT